ncbi:DMT family transporter [Cognatiyoonia sp. IB215446]|uniref:DMT family transporter n=1 Tax=Cognatiyoonia sp. IB215446 TaxID=3097355 RepID=UPI002A130759|nr:DMT family transporter [Cognatiyoonia sp. IB215446]MDX8347230.1 DMT family transporter [Cognatiyoonia sp. IB215446]
MRLFLLVALTMTAFASNSLLNRVGVASYGMDPFDFAVIRTGAGAAMLWGLVVMRSQAKPQLFATKRIAGALALGIYMIGFSWAYLTLDAGLGALILFGVLQVVVFGWAVITGQPIPIYRWIGAVIALIGLVVLLWPTGSAAVPFFGALAMVAAGVAWAAYTLLGRAEADALGATASNFLLCLPLVALTLLIAGDHNLSLGGVIAAIAAGAITSGLGYALWYRVLPDLATTVAGIAQLSVPVIAVAGGVLLLGEALTPRLIFAGMLVLGGIAISLIPRR